MRVSITLILLSMAIPIAAMAQQDTDAPTPSQDVGVTNINEKIYTWVDEDGVEHFVDSPSEVPPDIEVDEYDLDQVDRLSVVGEGGLRESEKQYLDQQIQEGIEEEKADGADTPPMIVAPSGGAGRPVVVDEGTGGVVPIDSDDDRAPGFAGPGPDNIPDDPGLSTVVGNDNFVDDGFATDDTDLADDTLNDGTLTGTRDGDLDGDLDGGTLTGNQDVNIGDDAVGTDIDIDTGIATGDGSDAANGGTDGDTSADNATRGIGIGGGVAPADTGGTTGGTTGGASSGGAGTTAGGSLGTSAGGS